MPQPHHPPPPHGPLPDLAPLGVTFQWHPDGSAFDVGYLITNRGAAPARGGFKITLYAHFRSHAQDPALDVDIEDHLTFPSNIDIQPGDIYPSGYLEGIPFRPNKLDTEYPMVAYTFECHVDTEGQVSESNKQNNGMQNPLNIGLPLIIRPPIGPIHQ